LRLLESIRVPLGGVFHVTRMLHGHQVDRR
jgi:hypothetical protein